jgi:hypothetical protein
MTGGSRRNIGRWQVGEEISARRRQEGEDAKLKYNRRGKMPN